MAEFWGEVLNGIVVSCAHAADDVDDGRVDQAE